MELELQPVADNSSSARSPSVGKDGASPSFTVGVRKLGDAGVAIALFKANLGVGILCTPGAALNGGLALWPLMLLVVFALSVLCVFRLLRSRLTVKTATCSYGDLMALAMGRSGRFAVELSTVLLQIGVCSLMLIFLGKTLMNLLTKSVPLAAWIAVVAVLELPLVMLRDVSKLFGASLVGSVLVSAGVVAVIALEAHRVLAHGLGPQLDLEPLGRAPLVAVGTACYCLEGIGLVIPAYESHAEPGRFSSIYHWVMTVILLCILLLSILGYLAFGDAVEPFVLSNLPQGRFQHTVRVVFACNVFFTIPLQLMPVSIVLESYVFRQPTEVPMGRRNSLRVSLVACMVVIAVAGATSLSNFVSLVGSLCGMPLAFVFPALCHFKLTAQTASTTSRVADLAIVVVGLAATVVVTWENVIHWGKAV